jgi:hypothetical protein
MENDWVMRDYKFRWVALGRGGVEEADESIDRLMDRVAARGLQDQVRYTFAYAPEWWDGD